MGGDLVGPRWTSGSRMAALLTPFTSGQLPCSFAGREPGADGGGDCRPRNSNCGNRRRDRRSGLPSGAPSVTSESAFASPGHPSSCSARDLLAPLQYRDHRAWIRAVRRERKDAVLVLVRYLAERFPDYSRRRTRRSPSRAFRNTCVRVPAIPNLETPDYFRLANATVSIPSADGTPMTAMESLACGTPVVMGDLAAYDPQVFGDGDSVPRVDPKDPADLARVLVRLAQDEQLRSRLALRGLAIVEQHADEDRELDRMEACYRSVLQGSQA